MTKTYVIVGASTGLGRATARTLSRDPDHRVIVAGRNVAELRVAVPNASDILRVDLADLADTARFATELTSFARLDGLICNAGVQTTAAPTFTVDGYESTFAVNHLAHFAIATRLAPQTSRLVFIGSGTHDPNIWMNRWFGFRGGRYTDARGLAAGRGDPSVGDAQRARDRYATSKLCNLLTVEALARRGFDARSFDPGLMPGTGLARDYGWIARVGWHTAMRLAALVMPGASSIRRSGNALAWVATEPELGGRHLDYRRRAIEPWTGATRLDWSEELYASSLELVSNATALRSAS